ncbi:MAG: peptide chain release factor N(5)-glutamine methyltransferase [Candidatus Omnitrophica bacterium]|nr:peptide chain release factor N(5)-glutamine methyltransferase [Candidatus Omnitrophota bacterium]
MSAVLADATAVLTAAGIERPRWTAEQLAASVLGCEPLALIVAPPAIDDAPAAKIHRQAARRAQGVPLQHLTGIAGFFGRDFLVEPGVFIPRPETERLVETVVAELTRVRWPAGGPTVWDVGTGSGVIAISVALTSGTIVGTLCASDINPQALALAARNARRLGAPHRCHWVRGDLLSACAAGRADVIVANLPYLPSSALPALPRDVQYDPPMALDGGPDGLALIRRLMAQAARALRRPGALLLEVGAGQAEIVRREAGGAWADVTVIADETGLDRVVALRP